MTTQLIKTCGSSGDDFPTSAALKTFLASFDAVATDQNLLVLLTADISWQQDVKVKSTDTTRRVTIRPKVGLGVNELSRDALDYGTVGIQLTFPRLEYGLFINTGVDFENLRIKVGSTGQNTVIIFQNTNANAAYDNSIRYCRILDQTTESNPSFWFGNGQGMQVVSDTLLIMEGGARKIYVDKSTKTRITRCTFVARGTSLGVAQVCSSDYGGNTITDSVFIGFSGTIADSSTTTTNCYSNTTPTAGRTSGITVNTAAGGLVTNEANDYRPAAGGGLISKASSSAQYTLDILGNNRGSAADAGARQLNPAVPLPTATITDTTVDGRKITISGTTTGTPTSASASITPTSVAYNDGVAQTNVPVTLGDGTFTVVFDNARVGQYNSSLTFTNDGGAATATGSNTISVVGAGGVITSQVVDGQQVTVSGTTTGNPSSGTYAIMPASTPNGAVAVGPADVNLGNGTFSFSAIVQPGDYVEPLVRFATDAGTGFPASGGSPISILGFSGNPEAPESDGSAPVPTVTSVTVSPGTATGSATFSASVVGENSPSQTVTWTATLGTITSDGVFTEPAKTTSVQTITITATSVVDPSKSGTATVTIDALAAPTVTSVVVTPSSVTIGGGSIQQFSATVSGTNSPSQSVTWSASDGTISPSGVLNAPAANNSVQSIIVTATSVLDPSKSGTAVATVPAVVVPEGKTVTIELVTPSGVAISVGTQVSFACFAELTPKLFGAPISQGTATIGEGGMVELPLPSSAGEIVWADVTNSDGNPSTVHKAFSGPVVVD